jgi:hypothetical protein
MPIAFALPIRNRFKEAANQSLAQYSAFAFRTPSNLASIDNMIIRNKAPKGLSERSESQETSKTGRFV